MADYDRHTMNGQSMSEEAKDVSVWVCEYSVTQGCFHVDTLGKVLEVNRVAALEGVNPGYVILGIFGTQREASDFAKRWEQIMKENYS